MAWYPVCCVNGCVDGMRARESVVQNICAEDEAQRRRVPYLASTSCGARLYGTISKLFRKFNASHKRYVQPRDCLAYL